jgi:hypothetical protein
MFKLIVNPGTDQTWEIPLSPGVTIIGSDPGGEFPIAHETVAAVHCQMLVNDGLVTIKDLGSGYGTFVDHALVEEAALDSGQIITLGAVDMELVSDHGAGEVGEGHPPLAPPGTYSAIRCRFSARGLRSDAPASSSFCLADGGQFFQPSTGSY